MKLTVEEHGIANVRVERIGSDYALVCECGYRTPPHKRVEHAVAEWQRHRDKVT